MVWLELAVVTIWGENTKLVGEKAATGVGLYPVPVSAILTAAPVMLVPVKLPYRVPPAVGAKEMLKVHEVPAGSPKVGQLFIWMKSPLI